MMKLNHIALNIADKEEMQNFYENILGFHVERSFGIDEALSQKIFNVSKPVVASILTNGELVLELFVNSKPLQTAYQHLCIDVKDREQIVQHCRKAAYPVIRLKRQRGDLLFIKDKAGNMFELKNRVLQKPP